MRYALLAFAIFAGSCADKDGKTVSPSSSATGESCEAKVRDLDQWMSLLAEEGGYSPAMHRTTFSDVRLVLLDSPVGPIEGAISMSLVPDAMLIEGSPVVTGDLPGDTEKAIAFLKAVKQEADSSGHLPDFLNLIIDQSIPWSMVVLGGEVARQAGFPSVAFVFEYRLPKRKLSTPAPSSMTKEIAEFVKEMQAVARSYDPAERQPQMSEPKEKKEPDLLDRVSATCPEIKATVAATGNLDPDKRVANLTTSVVAAVGACDCKVDIPALKEFYWYVMLSGDRRSKATAFHAELVAPETSGAVVVSASGRASWLEVYTKIVELPQGITAPKIVLQVE